MTEAQAIAAASRALPDHNAPQGVRAVSAELRWVELPLRGRDAAGPVRDAKVWVVTFAREGRRALELAVEDSTGSIVRAAHFR